MPKFIVNWSMSGEVVIEAPTREAAQEEFDSMSTYQIVDTHDEFSCDQPETDAERDEAYAKWRADLNAMADMQDTAEERRHG